VTLDDEKALINHLLNTGQGQHAMAIIARKAQAQPMTTITEFLLARIAEDEAVALPFRNELGDTTQWRCDEIGGAVRQVGTPAFGLPDLLAKFDTHLEGAHVARWDPARVLAECAAKRAIIGEHRESRYFTHQGCVVCRTGDGPLLPVEYPCPTVRALAAVYADHPDYQSDWAL
jgi:hypothetical protein